MRITRAEIAGAVFAGGLAVIFFGLGPDAFAGAGLFLVVATIARQIAG